MQLSPLGGWKDRLACSAREIVTAVQLDGSLRTHPPRAVPDKESQFMCPSLNLHTGRREADLRSHI